MVNRPRIRIHTRVSLSLFMSSDSFFFLLAMETSLQLEDFVSVIAADFYPALLTFRLLSLNVVESAQNFCSVSLWDPSGSKRIHEADNFFLSRTADLWFHLKTNYAQYEMLLE